MRYFIIGSLFISSVCFANDIKISPVISYKSCRKDFAVKLCQRDPDKYSCFKFSKKGQDYVRWEEVFSSDRIRELEMKINRRNSLIWKNHCVAVGNDLSKDEIYYSPFDFVNNNYKEKVIIVDLNKLAWGAYENSKLIKWGIANGGIGRCKETGKYTCKTPVGEQKVLNKSKFISKSTLYPVDCKDKKICGHPLFWAVQFGKVEKIHGDKHLPGFNASHGCVRVLIRDAKFINNFTEIGTKIVVLPY